MDMVPFIAMLDIYDSTYFMGIWKFIKFTYV